MSTVAPAVEPVAPTRTSGLAAIFEHTRYVLGENRVTAFAYALLVVIVFAALFGPYVVPYDPLTSDTAAALKPPSAAHWFGTDQLGPKFSVPSLWRPRLAPFFGLPPS